MAHRSRRRSKLSFLHKLRKSHFRRKRGNRDASVAAFVWGLKAAGKCSRCPADHPACLTFHHRDPATKRFDVGSASRKGIPLELVQLECLKCDLLCANCHAMLHYAERHPKAMAG